MWDFPGEEVKAVGEPDHFGLLNVYKPSGLSSHEVVQRIRRVSGISQVGHAGTLDPDASGVLPIAVGNTTRLLEWLNLTPKVYQATMILGQLTHTGDVNGREVGWSGPPYPSRDELESASRWLRGTIWQIPPQVSALKQGGRTAHAEVRRGRVVWPRARQVAVSSLRVLSGGERSWRIEATVGGGTYVRALVRDWGYLLGQASHLDHLVRTRVGRFSLQSAVPLAILEAHGKDWGRFLEPPAAQLAIPRVRVSEERLAWIRHGRLPDEWPELVGYGGDVGLQWAEQVVAVVHGPPWRYRKVLL